LSISHNKFVILLRGKTPVAVWTGSTNHTSDGLFGQSNVGHALTDRTVARTYLDYWRMIATNPSRAAFAAWNDEHTPLSRLDGSDGIKVVFSPRSTTEAMRRYESMLAKARHGAFLTAAFGVSNEFTEVLLQRRKYLRYILMDNKGQTGNAANTVKIRQNPLNLIALGDVIKSGELGHWPEEHLTGLNEWVKYVHTKFLLLDPLSDRPTVLTGSANFSDASVTSNDENMLIIRGDTRVADVYLSDFMRQFTGFAFRNQLDQITEHDYGPRGKHLRDAKRRKPLDIHLAPDASWLKPHFKRGSPLEMQRLYFSGQARD
jgi:phosphatidylserine/phosphatidylglycerophosphate/cardiolipin synthase-like enzyme